MPLSVTPRALLLIIASAVLALGVALLAAPPARAASAAVFYHAQLAEPASAATIVAGGTAWRCEGSSCSAPKSSTRDAIVCAKLVKEVGQLTSFSSPKGTLEGDDLARCNQG